VVKEKRERERPWSERRKEAWSQENERWRAWDKFVTRMMGLLSHKKTEEAKLHHHHEGQKKKLRK